MAALTGVAPVSLGLKGRDPELLDDKAERSADKRTPENQFPGSLLNTHKKENTRPASPFNAIRRTACLVQNRTERSCDFAKKNTHRRPSRSEISEWFGRPQDLHADVG